ncbi:response regulator [Candidatus Woesearchaeota archaeon]|nr:response regulator [Candidatus Woesearchaeota archaeon]
MCTKVLIVEDEEGLYLVMWRRTLGDAAVTLLSAPSIAEARQLFAANPDIAAIAVDACVPGREPNTLSLVQEFRQTFHGPMIAISGNEDYRQQLIQAGCSHECSKHLLPKTLREVLNI